MATFFSGLLGVMLLLDPNEDIDAEAAAAISEDADRVELPSGTVRRQNQSSARIRSNSSVFDRNAGVVLFEGNTRTITCCAPTESSPFSRLQTDFRALWRPETS